MSQFDAIIVLALSFHESHVWKISLSENKLEISGKCQSASVSTQLSEAQIKNCLNTVFSLQYNSPRAENTGLDGVSVDYSIERDGEKIQTRIWNPNNATSADFNRLTKWAWEALYGVNSEYDKYLEQVHSYFHDWGTNLWRQKMN